MRFFLGKLRVSTPLVTCLAASLLSTPVFADESQNGYQQSRWLLAQTDDQGNQPAPAEPVMAVPAAPAEPAVQALPEHAPVQEVAITHAKPTKHQSYHKYHKKNKHKVHKPVAKPIKHSYPHQYNTAYHAPTAKPYPVVTAPEFVPAHHQLQSLPQPAPAPMTDYVANTAVATPVQQGAMVQKSMPRPLETDNKTKPWSGIISAGYTDYSNMYSGDGGTGLARLAIARSVYALKHWNFGLEVGMQNGNTMRLESTQAALDLLGGIPIQTTVKPEFDLLASIKETFENTPFFLIGKAGIAYRRWQFNNLNQQTINDLSQVNAEVQAGLGYDINARINLSVLYQGIFGSNPNLTVNTTAGTGTVSNIPMQNGALLSLSVVV